ncbi:MAG TPA: lysophospholipid acyltransferase family protein [Myxococcota bacterium]|nr:lysophospholipid acyltransferase family protein [Myxococcota bacterium]
MPGADEGTWKDPFPRRLARRIVTIPLYVALCGLLLASLPALLVVALVADAVRRDRLVLTRCLLFFQWYLLCEVLGIAVALAIVTTTRDRDRELERFFRLQCGWLGALFWGSARVFGFRVETEGDEALAGGPLLVFMRHASTADIALPNVLISARTGLVLRYVLKRELLWDPCLDVAGHRLVNCFIRRGSGNAEREIAAVRSLGAGLGPDDGVLIYPEGTRFTPEKQTRALDRIRATGHAERIARAEKFDHVLPPRLGGPVALLDEAPEADVVFLAHTGLDGARTMRDFLNGALVGARVRVAFWRVAAHDVPRDAEAREHWLFEEWQRLDDWVGRNASARATA